MWLPDLIQLGLMWLISWRSSLFGAFDGNAWYGVLLDRTDSTASARRNGRKNLDSPLLSAREFVELFVHTPAVEYKR